MWSLPLLSPPLLPLLPPPLLLLTISVGTQPTPPLPLLPAGGARLPQSRLRCEKLMMVNGSVRFIIS